MLDTCERPTSQIVVPLCSDLYSSSDGKDIQDARGLGIGRALLVSERLLERVAVALRELSSQRPKIFHALKHLVVL